LTSHFYAYSVYERSFQKNKELIINYEQKNNELSMECNDLVTEYNALAIEYQIFKSMNFLETEYDNLSDDCQTFQNNILQSIEANCTAVTIVYYTNFSANEQKITLSVPYENYDFYHTRWHPNWGENFDPRAVTEYITSDEPLITEIVMTVKSKTQSKEELANALLDFVQDKGHILSLRCYPSTSAEYKYPIETLVEMGGDCDAHAVLYGTLMKEAGFKVLLVLSERIGWQYHVAVAVHLEKPPTNSRADIENFFFTYNGEKYYYAETTSWNWRVGDLPPKLYNLTFSIMPL